MGFISTRRKESKMKSENKDLKKVVRLQRIRNDFAAWILIIPLLIVMYLCVWRPTVMSGVWSFFKMKGYTPTEFIGLRNYVEVISDTQFIPTLVNTLEYVLWSFVVGFIPPVIIAVMINEMVHLKSFFKTFTYLPAVIPGVAAYLIWYFVYSPDTTGLLNMLLSKIGMEPYVWLNDERFTILYIIISSTWHAFPGTMVLYLAALQSVQVELYEAATVDGAGMFCKLRNVTIPQISGMLLLGFVNQIIGVFQTMEQPMTMTGGGPNNASITVGLQLYKYGFVNGRAGHAMALGVIIFLILIVVTSFYFYLNKKIEKNR